MAEQPIHVLVIEDDPDYLRSLRDRLSKDTSQLFHVYCATTLQEGLTQLGKGGSDVILLDLMLPESQGLQTYERIHAHTPEIPVIVLTAVDNDALAIEAVRRGAQDFLVKGQVEGKLLSRVIRYAIERHRMQAALRSLSLLDDLTGLYNRRGFSRLAEQHLKLANRTKRGSLLMFIDVDGLKQINDTVGHPEGDRALTETAEILKHTFRSSDVIARIGGDEFAVIAIDASQNSAAHLVMRLQEKLQAANAQPGRRYPLSLSVGVASLDPQSTQSLEALMAKADEALYQQKRSKASRTHSG